jgi:hypothetical protein
VLRHAPVIEACSGTLHRGGVWHPLDEISVVSSSLSSTGPARPAVSM